MAAAEQEFTDDSSSSLKLDHSATTGASGPRRLSVAGSGIEKHFAPQEAEHRRLLAEAFDKRVRQLMDDGCTLNQAKKLAQAERENPTILRDLRDFEGDRQRALEYLMDVYRDVKGGSSGSSSKYKSVKTGTRVCPNCHLEGCQCYAGPGRPFEDGRSERVHANVRRGVKEQLVNEGVSAGRIVQASVDLANSLGVSVEAVILVIEATKADPSRVAALFGRATLQNQN